MTLREHLAALTQRAKPIAQLLDQQAVQDAARDPEKLLELATSVARSVLVDPAQPIGDVNAPLECMVQADTPLARLALLDLVSALSCLGAVIRPDLDAYVRRGLDELASVGPPLALRMRVGFASIVYGEVDIAKRIASELPELFHGDEEFPNDVLALLAYAAARVHSGSGTLDAAWRRVAVELPALCASGQLDESAVLWLARVVYQSFEGSPVERVAALAHDHLWTMREEPASTNEAPDFPLTDTIGGGAYRVVQHLRGHGQQTLWLGRELATGADVFVTCDLHNPRKQDVEGLRRGLEYRIPGVYELAYLGAFDANDSRAGADPTHHWGTVEKVPGGSWLPHVLGPADPWTAPTKALALGRSAGRILVRASDAGVKLARIRPELMWAERRDNRIAVTGLSPRATELFSRRVGEMVTWPLFERFYHAPEIDQDPDDRAVAYSLAVMIAEWATGRYPFASKHAADGVETAAHDPIDAPPPLARLLEATIRRDRDQRPRLVDLVAELDRLTL